MIILLVTTCLLGAIISLINPRTHQSSRDTGQAVSEDMVKPVKDYVLGNEYLNIDSRSILGYTGLTTLPAREVQGQVCQSLQCCILSVLG